jgi:hypothetical protein
MIVAMSSMSATPCSFSGSMMSSFSSGSSAIASPTFLAVLRSFSISPGNPAFVGNMTKRVARGTACGRESTRLAASPAEE